ncbi:MAG: hypothetical protein ACI8WB_002199, partial [Phenylobacterium sp.]
VMRQAMNTLQSIADSEEAYLAYLAREDQLMIERTIESQLKESKANLTQAKHRAKKAEADKATAEAGQATAEAENAQLLALLKQAGIDPKIL